MKIGYIFLKEEYSKAFDFCNQSKNTDNPCHIEEIESKNNIRRFQIIKDIPFTNIENLKIKIDGLRFYLKNTDWYVTRKIETGKEIPEDVSNKREEVRDEISRLVEENEDLKQYL